MSSDMWNILYAKHFTSKIAIGTINGGSHAWILVETSPSKWLAVETTGGLTFRADQEPAYFSPVATFDNPLEMKRYFDHIDQTKSWRA
jgi:hypothetical protein